MYYLNHEDEYSDGYVEYQEDKILEKIKTYPAYHFLEGLINTGMFWTPDNTHYFLMQETWVDDTYKNKSVAYACVKFGPCLNTWLDYNEWKKTTVHIDFLCIHNEWRGLGTLSVLSRYLQECAEDAGVFIYGHARPFGINLPMLKNQNEAADWINTIQEENEYVGLKQEKKDAWKLYQKYKELGFCNYDGVGIDFENRWWRKTCFGYRSAKLNSNIVGDFLDLHLNC